MQRVEYDNLFVRTTTIINPGDLYNKNDRTLLWGYTINRDSWHVYLLNNKIIRVRYGFKQEPKILSEVINNQQYVPSKRLYPEACDYEFCKLLQERGIYLPFTTWNYKRPEMQFYGDIV